MDLIYACGGGIMGHPMGVAAGVRSLQQAWEAAAANIPLADLRGLPSRACCRARALRNVTACRSLYTYYGDDFTGSTDVLEQLGANGIPAVLFLGAADTCSILPPFRTSRRSASPATAAPARRSGCPQTCPQSFAVLKQFNAPDHSLQNLLHLR